jgi:hypothetical protein
MPPPASPRFRLRIDGIPVAVLATPDAAVALPSVAGPAQVEVEIIGPARSAVLRPLRHGIAMRPVDGILRFAIPGPGHYSIEIDGDLAMPLLILASAPIELPEPSSGVIVFGPGDHDLGEIEVPDGGTIVLAAGAWLNGAIHLRGRRGITIRGPGVIDASGPRGGGRNPILIEDCEQVVVDGPLLISRGQWNLILRRCRIADVRGVRVVSTEPCSDGIDVDGSSRVAISGCFIKCNDDCVVIKSTPLAAGSPVEDVSVADCVLWNGPAGNGIEIGYESATTHMRRIAFRRIDLIHVQCDVRSGWIDRIAAIAMHLVGPAQVDDVVFEDITCEDVQTPKLIQVMVFHYHRDHGWFSPAAPAVGGRIRGLCMRRLRFPETAIPRLHIEGWNGPDDFDGVELDDIRIGGKDARNHPGLVREFVNAGQVRWS